MRNPKNEGQRLKECPSRKAEAAWNPSAGGAADSSPRREPWVRVASDPSPGRGGRTGSLRGEPNSIAPSGARLAANSNPRLTPWATVFRRSAAGVASGFGLGPSCFVILALAALSASAQTYSIDWSKVSGGGGTSTGGVYVVSGTLGQHDAGTPMSGGGFSLTGGFWSFLSLVQTPGAPLLSIRYTTTNTAVVSWPSPSTGFNLQSATDLGLSNWVNSALSPSDDGTNRFLIVTPPTGNGFFRLLKP